MPTNRRQDQLDLLDSLKVLEEEAQGSGWQHLMRWAASWSERHQTVTALSMDKLLQSPWAARVITTPSDVPSSVTLISLVFPSDPGLC